MDAAAWMRLCFCFCIHTMACHTTFPYHCIWSSSYYKITSSLVSQNENSAIIYLPPCHSKLIFSFLWSTKSILRLLRERESCRIPRVSYLFYFLSVLSKKSSFSSALCPGSVSISATVPGPQDPHRQLGLPSIKVTLNIYVT